MRFRFLSVIFLGVLVLAACSLDYNNYPYQDQTQTTQPTEWGTPPITEESTESTTEQKAEEKIVESEPTLPATITPLTVEVTPVTTTQEETPPAHVPETKIFAVSASQFSFSPSTLTVNKGDTVVINFTATDVPHGFSLPDFNVSLVGAELGKVVTASFIADKAGTFTFACSVVCGTGHSDMKGTFVVNDV